MEHTKKEIKDFIKAIHAKGIKFTGKVKDIHEEGDDGEAIHCLDCDGYVEQTATTKKDVYLCECVGYEDDEGCGCTFFKYYHETEEDIEFFLENPEEL